LSETEREELYDMGVVRGFALSALIWGIVGMAVGLVIALQLAWPQLNVGPYFHFGRLRPVHTNVVIFGFTLGVVFAGSYYAVQRLCRARLPSDFLARLHLWLWNLTLVAAGITLVLGKTTSKEYAELEWPLDIAVVVMWVIYGVNFFGTIARRRERGLYAALWFFGSTILTIAMLYIFNNLERPVSLWKSYSIYAGVHDANIQWWYGHNAVGFVLTTPILGLMYYFLPRQAERPIYSHRLSILHFWSLIFVYIWAGPHHLLFSPLPEWTQSLGTAFSIMLLLPSWGGMLNGLLTLRGAWHRVGTDPILKMFVVGLTFYGMSTFEGPMMSIKTVNSLSHFTSWTIAHVHSGALGWVALTSFATLYYLVPRLWHTPLWELAAGGGPLLGRDAGDRALRDSDVGRGSHSGPDVARHQPRREPDLHLRRLGRGRARLRRDPRGRRRGVPLGRADDVLERDPDHPPRLGGGSGRGAGARPAVGGRPLAVAFEWHRKLETNALVLSILTFLAVAVGGLVLLIPPHFLAGTIEPVAGLRPYSPLELEGRDIYIREGCNVCHSQEVRPFKTETDRYGHYSLAGEGIYDRPFLWGSRRIGPDLARVGGKYPPSWHWLHFRNPRDIEPRSNMPSFAFLEEQELDLGSTRRKLEVLRDLGHPYSDAEIAGAEDAARAQAAQIAAALRANGIALTPTEERSETIAVIAYLETLGRAIKAEPVQSLQLDGKPQ